MGIFKKKNQKAEIAVEEKSEVPAVSVEEKKTKKGLNLGILSNPILSEKTAKAEARGIYTFSVPLQAGKPEIMKAVQSLYGIRPIKINVSHVEGKATKTGKTSGRRKNWKKAMVMLPQGKTISIHPGV